MSTMPGLKAFLTLLSVSLQSSRRYLALRE